MKLLIPTSLHDKFFSLYTFEQLEEAVKEEEAKLSYRNTFINKEETSTPLEMAIEPAKFSRELSQEELNAHYSLVVTRVMNDMLCELSEELTYEILPQLVGKKIRFWYGVYRDNDEPMNNVAIIESIDMTDDYPVKKCKKITSDDLKHAYQWGWEINIGDSGVSYILE